jgi:hypothetical protein
MRAVQLVSQMIQPYRTSCIPRVFRPPYVGAAGWVGVQLVKVADDQLRALIREAFRLATKPK